MKNNKIVLVPVDFTDVCFDAINYGSEIARSLGYSVLLLHVIDKKSKADLKKEDLTESAIEKRLDDIVKRNIKMFGIKTSGIACDGSIFTTIGKVAGEKGAALVVIGSHGIVGVQQKIAGSWAKKVVVSCPVPVIVIQKGAKFGKGFKNIVFPVSTTAEVRQKTAWAVLMANTFKSRIHVFQLNEAAEESRKKMKVVLGQITKEFDKAKISYMIAQAVPRKSFSDQVITYAKDNNAELISIMTRPSSYNFVFNRYTEKVILNQFQIPVLCINPFETWEEIWKF